MVEGRRNYKEGKRYLGIDGKEKGRIMRQGKNNVFLSEMLNMQVGENSYYDGKSNLEVVSDAVGGKTGVIICLLGFLIMKLLYASQLT